MNPLHSKRTANKHVVVVGAGNIGTHLIPLVARNGCVGRLSVIDHDLYEKKNLTSQAIAPADVGSPKALVQARRARTIAPHVEVEAIVARVEDLPWGALSADVVLSALDSKRARQTVNERTRRLGAPWIDSGVEASALLARVSCFGPGAEQPCYECTWDERDYDQLERIYSCEGKPVASVPTGAPAALGALAASWQAMHCDRVLRGDGGELFGRQVVLSPGSDCALRSTLPPNPDCRMGNHAAWKIEPLTQGPGQLTLGDAFSLATTSRGPQITHALSLPGQAFVSRLWCPTCGATRETLSLDAQLRVDPPLCNQCEAPVRYDGMDMSEALWPSKLGNEILDLTLAEIGFRDREIFSLRSGDVSHYFALPASLRETAGIR